MERMLTILLVEDDPLECNEISAYIERFDDIELIGITNNADKALKDIIDKLPDAIILDLELHKGSGNGLTLLQELQSINLSFKPYILITTHNPSAITHDIARQNGADFIMTKYQEDYSAKTVVDFLRTLKHILHSKKPNDKVSFIETPEQKKERFHRRICREFDLIGISHKDVGYKYLIDAILLIIDKPTPNICVIIGQNYGKTEASVERGMQNAINKAWSYGDIEQLYKYYTAKIHSDKGVPTVTEFIYYYAYKIKNEYLKSH